MMTETSLPPALPLFVLHPVLDAHSRPEAVRVSGPGRNDAAAVARLLTEFGLAEATSGLPVLLPAPTLAAVTEAGAPMPEGTALAVDPGSATTPPPAPTTHTGPAAAVMLKLLSQVTGDADTRDIESTLKQDPQLSLQLLRLVNSAAFAPTSRIASFSQAITLLGRRQLQRWLQLLLFARGPSAEQSNPLLTQAAMRAALMEALAKAAGGSREMADEAYMVGMFSLLEQLFGKPLAGIIGSLQLDPAIADALLEHKGALGGLLKLVEASDCYPDTDTAGVAVALSASGVDSAVWCSSQITALRWTLQLQTSRGG